MDRVYSLPGSGFWMFPRPEDDEGAVFYSFGDLMVIAIPRAVKCLRHRESGILDGIGCAVGLEEERNEIRKSNIRQKSNIIISYEIYDRRRKVFYNGT